MEILKMRKSKVLLWLRILDTERHEILVEFINQLSIRLRARHEARIIKGPRRSLSVC